MSQMDYIHFLPSLMWTLILFLGFYFFMVTSFVPEMYKVHSVRKNYLMKLTKILKKELFITTILENFDLKLKEEYILMKLKNKIKLEMNKMKIFLKCI